MTFTHDETSHALVRPAVTAQQAETFAKKHYGISGTAHELGSNQDRNFVITSKRNERWVLRVDNPVFAQSAREAQHEAVAAYQVAGVRVPKVIPGKNNELTQHAEGHAFRLFEFLEGPSLVDTKYLAPSIRRELGALAARSVQALASVTHPGMDREHQWDMRLAHSVVSALAPTITDEQLRTHVLGVSAQANDAVQLVADMLPVQTIHGDLTDDNVACTLGDDGRLHPYAVLDFGDIALGWRVAELAVTCASLLHHEPDRPLNVLDAVRAFHEVEPLTMAEARAVWPLIVQRAAVLVASAHNQLSIDSNNEYARERIAGEQAIFDAATSISLAEGTESVLAALNLTTEALQPPQAHPAELIEGIQSAPFIDLGVESDQLNAGRWLDAESETEVTERALIWNPIAIMPYGTYRLTKALPNRRDAAKTFATHTTIAVRASFKAVDVFAPVTATVLAVTPETLELDLDGLVMTLTGLDVSVSVGDRVERGSQIGVMRTPLESAGLLRVHLRRPALTAPYQPFVSPELAPAWRVLTPDPAEFLGIASQAQRDESADELERRNRVFAEAQERYYTEPPQIERGWRHHLVDTTGRVYIDMVNNVTGLGHGHPKIADAIDKQIRVLNTNSRFLYRQLAEYSERLLELAPKGGDFDTVLLVNSGSEAVDLAIRLAQASTQRKTVVALREAYHGWTMASDAVTTSAFDNPYAMGSRPDWVHVADIPNIFRGTHRGADAGPKYVADLTKQLDELQKNQRDIAAFICETVLGNAGGVMLPEGYLQGVYDTVRAHGGLTIADEVQVGFGRMGDTFWGVELSGAIPDIITIAKPMGNGYPIGGVITSKKIADALSTEGNFFSSAGGSPVSCAVGIAVLDAMAEDKLQANAHEVGTHLKTRLEQLAQKHPLIGPIHGHGLYLGVELVRDRETLEPAAAEAEAISERLRELGLIVMTTSERKNVLKVKPPLCLTKESADFFVDALDEVLTKGW